MLATILLVESKNAGNNSLGTALDKADLNVEICTTGAIAIDWLENNQPDLVIIDSTTMRSNGIRISRRIREKCADIPIIHCRKSNSPIDRTAEADVYLAKPFTARKVLNRIRSLLPVDDLREVIVRAGNLTLYPSKRSIDIAGKGERRLTPKLSNLLEEFLRHPNEILARHYLMEIIWQTTYFGDTRTLDVHIRWIREIIEDNPAKPCWVRTIRGVGYIFGVPTRGEG